MGSSGWNFFTEVRERWSLGLELGLSLEAPDHVDDVLFGGDGCHAESLAKRGMRNSERGKGDQRQTWTRRGGTVFNEGASLAVVQYVMAEAVAISGGLSMRRAGPWAGSQATNGK